MTATGLFDIRLGVVQVMSTGVRVSASRALLFRDPVTLRLTSCG